MFDNKDVKIVRSDDYNTNFSKKDGSFMRWGKTENDDPQFSPIGPEIADIEITTSCKGVPGKDGLKSPCKFCYKSNTPTGTYMTLETFKNVFHNLPKNVGQIAYGVDSECNTNPDWFEIFKYARENGVIPNVTVANITDETADKLTSVCGAVAVSRYDNKDVCYDTIKRLTDRGLKQCNIHILVAEEVYDNVMETLRDRLTDPRLSKLNAIVLLSLKQCGRGKSLNQLSKDKFRSIIDFAMENKISIGFDSCSCHRFLDAVKDYPEDLRRHFDSVSEPCESLCFSLYCSVDGKFFPCSFSENIEGWEDGLDLVNCQDFMKDIWYHPKSKEFRKKLLDGNRKCPIYEIEKE